MAHNGESHVTKRQGGIYCENFFFNEKTLFKCKDITDIVLTFVILRLEI